ncbi:EF-hand domain-containing protein [Stenotrophomonas sp. LGBM10]|uniref:EF-hand domain-containing protein n=1 Tax=Stenotrophomonas sp. LGBM10 TaxID=3390038 RepID=UPI00398B02EF
MRRLSSLALLLWVPAVVCAQVHTPPPAISAPLREVPVSVRTQPLAQGKVTHQVTLPAPAGEAEVTVRSVQPVAVVGQYRFAFQALDVDGDGFISREEAQANPALADEFTALDVKRRGKLDRADLAGWLVD